MAEQSVNKRQADLSIEHAYSSSISQDADSNMEESENSGSTFHKQSSRVGIYEFTQEQQDRVLEILSRNVSIAIFV
jgi:hypothetical protein